MKKIISITFCTLIGIALVCATIFFNRQGDVFSTEKRAIASKPSNITDFKGWDAYFNDRFGGRDQLIDLANYIDRNLMDKTIKNAKAFQGKNGWFFYINTADGNNQGDFDKTNLLNEDELKQFKDEVTDITSWCHSNDIKCLFVICPNKHNVYPEYHILTRPDGKTRTEQLLEAFDQAHVKCIYPLNYLLSKKKESTYPIYYETDTHWNDLGAFYAFEKIREEISLLFPDKHFPQIEYKTKVSFSESAGDILPMLNIKNAKSTRISLSPVKGKLTDYFSYIKNEGRDGIITKGKDATLPRAIIFRDSFCTAMVQYLSTLFSEAEYDWRRITEEDKQNIIANKPDIIIFESVERNSISIVKE